MNFVDFKKTLGSVIDHHYGLSWRRGIPDDIITIIKNL